MFFFQLFGLIPYQYCGVESDFLPFFFCFGDHLTSVFSFLLESMNLIMFPHSVSNLVYHNSLYSEGFLLVPINSIVFKHSDHFLIVVTIL